MPVNATVHYLTDLVLGKEPSPPPAGTSMHSPTWVSLGSARGDALDTDTRGGHDRGAGLLALEFDLR